MKLDKKGFKLLMELGLEATKATMSPEAFTRKLETSKAAIKSRMADFGGDKEKAYTAMIMNGPNDGAIWLYAASREMQLEELFRDPDALPDGYIKSSLLMQVLEKIPQMRPLVIMKRAHTVLSECHPEEKFKDDLLLFISFIKDRMGFEKDAVKVVQKFFESEEGKSAPNTDKAWLYAAAMEMTLKMEKETAYRPFAKNPFVTDPDADIFFQTDKAPIFNNFSHGPEARRFNMGHEGMCSCLICNLKREYGY
jgi:hypothetical protein